MQKCKRKCLCYSFIFGVGDCVIVPGILLRTYFVMPLAGEMQLVIYAGVFRPLMFFIVQKNQELRLLEAAVCCVNA